MAADLVLRLVRMLKRHSVVQDNDDERRHRQLDVGGTEQPAAAGEQGDLAVPAGGFGAGEQTDGMAGFGYGEDPVGLSGIWEDLMAAGPMDDDWGQLFGDLDSFCGPV